MSAIYGVKTLHTLSPLVKAVEIFFIFQIWANPLDIVYGHKYAGTLHKIIRLTYMKPTFILQPSNLVPSTIIITSSPKKRYIHRASISAKLEPSQCWILATTFDQCLRTFRLLCITQRSEFSLEMLFAGLMLHSRQKRAFKFDKRWVYFQPSQWLKYLNLVVLVKI